jgi:hypothetical protein
MMRDMKVRALALCLAALAALVVASASAAPIRTPVPAAGMTIVLPPTWKRVDAGTAASAAAKALARENPELATVLQQLGRPDSVIKLFAYDPRGAATFATNLNIVVSPIPRGVTIVQYLGAAQAEIANLPGLVGTPVTWIERLPAGQAVRTTVRFTIVRDGKRVVADVSQWAFLLSGKSIVVSFTTTPAKRARYVRTFVTTARSIRFG